MYCLCRVYPRACGGTRYHFAYAGLGMGLSPRLRGNGEIRALLSHRGGSIPALAGERLHLAVNRI